MARLSPGLYACGNSHRGVDAPHHTFLYRCPVDPDPEIRIRLPRGGVVLPVRSPHVLCRLQASGRIWGMLDFTQRMRSGIKTWAELP